MSKIILEWTYKLQHDLDKMSTKELNKFLSDKAIRYDGKLYTLGDENEQGKNSKAKRKTNRSVKGSNKGSATLDPAIN